MIEGVDPSDTDTMDELDRKVVYFLGGRIELKHYGNSFKVLEETFGSGIFNPVRKYTRSRDALKAIRPDGYMFYIDNFDPELTWFQCSGWCKEIKYETISTPSLPTEELAELHAIIQAIEYERETKSE